MIFTLAQINDIMFQFHEGPIKTILSELNIKPSKMFQFHEGPIKTSRVGYLLMHNLVSIP